MLDELKLKQLRAIVRTGGKPMIACQVCGTKYLFKAKGAPKLYCSDKCRKKAARQAKAAEKSA